MYLTIDGSSKSVDKKTLTNAVEFYATCLDIDRKNIDIYLDFEKELEKNFKENAYCVNEGCNQYTITIDPKFGKRKTLIALAHEMVHVKQYAKRELTYNSRKKLSRFKGQAYEDNINYWDQPWEIEAFGRELGLYVQFKYSEKKKK